MTNEFQDVVKEYFNKNIEFTKLSKIIVDELGTDGLNNLTPDNFHVVVRQAVENCEETMREIKRYDMEGFDVSHQSYVMRKFERVLDTIRTLDRHDETFKASDVTKLEESLIEMKKSRNFCIRQIANAQLHSTLNNISEKLLQVEKTFQEGKMSPEKAKKHVLKLKVMYDVVAGRIGDLDKDAYERMGKLINYYAETYQKEPLSETVTEPANLDEEIVPEISDLMNESNKSLDNYMTMLKLFDNFQIKPIGITNYDIHEKLRKIAMLMEDSRTDWDELDYEINQLQRITDIVYDHKISVDSKLKSKAEGFEILLKIGNSKIEKNEISTASAIYAQSAHEIGILEKQLAEIREIVLTGQNYPSTIALHHLGYIQSQVRNYKFNLTMIKSSTQERLPDGLSERLNALGENVIKSAEELGLITLKADSVAR